MHDTHARGRLVADCAALSRVLAPVLWVVESQSLQTNVCGQQVCVMQSCMSKIVQWPSSANGIRHPTPCKCHTWHSICVCFFRQQGDQDRVVLNTGDTWCPSTMQPLNTKGGNCACKCNAAAACPAQLPALAPYHRTVLLQYCNGIAAAQGKICHSRRPELSKALAATPATPQHHRHRKRNSCTYTPYMLLQTQLLVP